MLPGSAVPVVIVSHAYWQRTGALSRFIPRERKSRDLSCCHFRALATLRKGISNTKNQRQAVQNS